MPPPAPAPRRPASLDDATMLAALVAGAVGVCLLLGGLSMSGMTWDESEDLALARDYVAHRSFVTNTQDPSQGRLSHLWAAAFIGLLGPSYLAFKLPFVLAGLAGAAMLWSLLRRAYSAPTAALFVAFYLSNPYTLAACRQGATAGDGLVLVLSIACVLTLHRWVTSAAFWPWGAACALACGAATAAKWTGGLWVPMAAAVSLWYGRRRHRSLFAGQLWTETLAFGALSTAAAIAGSPTFLQGLIFVKDALAVSADFDTSPWLYLGAFRLRPPPAYFWVIYLSRATPGLALFALGAAASLASVAARLRGAGPLVPLALLALVPCLPLARKGFQNAHYYVGAVVPVLVLSAAFVERSRRGRRLDAPVRVAALLALAIQVGFSIDLWPDYLQAGRHFGPLMQGQFWGPAVNHCQGGPLALQKLNELTAGGDAPRAYVLGDCHEILDHDQRLGPLAYRGGTEEFPVHAPPLRPHFLLINGAYALTENSRTAWNEQMKLRDKTLARCSPGPVRAGTYVIYSCKGKNLHPPWPTSPAPPTNPSPSPLPWAR